MKDQVCAMKVRLTSHQQKFVETKMKGGGYLSEDEVIREALRVYELVEQEDSDPQLESALRHSLRSPLKRYKRGHFSALANSRSRRAIAA
jgi:putative addiction module CopG family antidote